jgi:hypothetical protein
VLVGVFFIVCDKTCRHFAAPTRVARQFLRVSSDRPLQTVRRNRRRRLDTWACDHAALRYEFRLLIQCVNVDASTG